MNGLKFALDSSEFNLATYDMIYAGLVKVNPTEFIETHFQVTVQVMLCNWKLPLLSACM